MSTTSQPSPKLKRTTSLRQQVRNLLKKCEINPTEPGPWQAIAETAGPEYLEHRAMEEVQRAIRSLKTEMAPSLQDFKLYEQHMIQATELLTLARLKRKTYLLEDKWHVCIVTQMGLEAGTESKIIEQRRLKTFKGKYQPMVPGVMDPSKEPTEMPDGSVAGNDYKIAKINSVNEPFENKIQTPRKEIIDMARVVMCEWCKENYQDYVIVGDSIEFKFKKNYEHKIAFCENEGFLYVIFDGYIDGNPNYGVPPKIDRPFTLKIISWVETHFKYAEQRKAQEQRKILDAQDNGPAQNKA